MHDLQRHVGDLQKELTQLHGVLNSEPIVGSPGIINMHENIDRVNASIHDLHNVIEGYSFQWGRHGKKKHIPVPKPGSVIPMGLVIPVVVDAMVDGFLIGCTCAISFKAGIVLGCANMVEMGFLGLSVSLRLQKCTASSVCFRNVCLVLPPVLLLCTTVIGLLVSNAAKVHPAVYLAFLSFGVVVLQYLAVNELLVEAREALSGKECWWSPLVYFGGIYTVILINTIF
jgi:zinc transporter ZupT